MRSWLDGHGVAEKPRAILFLWRHIMSFDLSQFTDLIKRVITAQDLYHDTALNLLLGTAAQESAFGTYLRQLEGGPALGVFQMEPFTETDSWNNYLFYGRADKRKAIYKISGVRSANNYCALEWNIAYAICMARLQYRRVKEPFPNPHDIVGMANYWKSHWNTEKGKGTEQKFIQNYVKYVGK